ncbi:MAG: POT family MFS transporter [Planctomycetota bacterium]|nr:POT family MFS transporter [Planctomycetota bacterium]
MTKYRTVPVDTTRMPSGVPFIIGNEVAERFSFYGMKSILTVFMTTYLINSAGEPDYMSEEDAKTVYHLFTAAAYFFPILGALIADILWGKFKTIMILSMGYCVGHACLAMGDTGIGTGIAEPRTWLFVGLAFIAVGAGGIKPCVSANVGDQFGKSNKHLVSKIFSWFYFSINVGAVTSSLLTPLLLAKVGPWLAFGTPGVLMALATLIFWMGRKKFVHIPAAGMNKFIEETFSKDGLRAILNLSPIFLIFIPMFWAIFDQSGSAWVIQATHMNLDFMGISWLPSQIQAVNPFLILVLIPTFTYLIYPQVDKVFKMTPMRKMSIGLFLTAGAFAISGWIQMRIDGGATPNIGWQFVAYFVLTAAEVMVSITSLEFAYTQAPKKMKSFIMGIYFLGISLGNLFAAAVNFFIQNDDGTVKLEGASYYWFFTILMVITSVVFIFVSKMYKGKTYLQEGDEEEVASEAKAEGIGDT